jgi:hypothetical protein
MSVGYTKFTLVVLTLVLIAQIAGVISHLGIYPRTLTADEVRNFSLESVSQ